MPLFFAAVRASLLPLLIASLPAQSILVKPYLQPGDGAALGTADVKVVAWLTDAVPGAFVVEFGVGESNWRTVKPTATPIEISKDERYLAYAATLADLPLNGEIRYRVKQGAAVVAENTFATRRTPDRPIRFVVTGDLASNDAGKAAVACQMLRAKPEFVVVCGDIAYNRGRISDYQKRFWPVYANADKPDPAVGAPIMQSVPFYMALGNHDAELADLAKVPDAFAAHYFFHVPRNALPAGSWRPFIPGTDEQVRRFRAAADPAGYPALCLYSFDSGPAHFLALDSNTYTPILSADYREWIRRDLMASKARWKFVYFHHPGFNMSASHRNHQKMRLLAPVFEEAGVDIVFAGHVHNYQRSKPLRFAPKDAIPEWGLPVRGTYQIDEKFDGATNTKPNGVLYIVTGGGGAELYAFRGKNSTPATPIVPDPDTAGNYMVKVIDDRHSFTLVELDSDKLQLRQLDVNGAEADRITITKK